MDGGGLSVRWSGTAEEKVRYLVERLSFLHQHHSTAVLPQPWPPTQPLPLPLPTDPRLLGFAHRTKARARPLYALRGSTIAGSNATLLGLVVG